MATNPMLAAMFVSAINWDVVDENAVAISGIFAKEED